MCVGICVELSRAFKRVLYVIISNLCGMYMRTISQICRIMGALCPKLAEQADFICRNLHIAYREHLRKYFVCTDLKVMWYVYEDNTSDVSNFGCFMAKTG